MIWQTQVCWRGLQLAARHKSSGKVVKAGSEEGCSGGWTFPTDQPQPCPRCRAPLTVLSRT